MHIRGFDVHETELTENSSVFWYSPSVIYYLESS